MCRLVFQECEIHLALVKKPDPQDDKVAESAVRVAGERGSATSVAQHGGHTSMGGAVTSLLCYYFGSSGTQWQWCAIT